jgi:hypothetical protein
MPSKTEKQDSNTEQNQYQNSPFENKVLIKLNLGCGQNPMPGYINVDKYGSPELQHDLETFPWPWAESSVDEIVMNHVLEHLGQEIDVYFGIIKELYRVCKPNGLIRINVPHPRHDDFINDPTHVRPITPEHLLLFSKKQNLIWQSQRKSNSPLGLYLDVDFEIVESMYKLEPYWENQFPQENGPQGLAIEGALDLAIRHHNNVVKEIWLDLKVVKPESNCLQSK